jgi:hypothetical protein
MDVTKDTLLRRADGLLAEARRARKLSAAQPPGPASAELIREAEALESRAARLEKDAISARNGVFAKAGQPASSASTRAAQAFDRISQPPAERTRLASATRDRPRTPRPD